MNPGHPEPAQLPSAQVNSAQRRSARSSSAHPQSDDVVRLSARVERRSLRCPCAPFLLTPLLLLAWVCSDRLAAADEATRSRSSAETREQFLESRFERVKELVRLGDYTTAFKLADALLVVAPNVPFRDELQRLRRLAEGRHLGANLLAARFEFSTEVAPFPRAALVGDLVIENLTGQVLELGGAGKTALLGQARFRLTESYSDGSEWTTEGTRNVSVASAFELQPGEVRRVPVRFEIPLGGAGPVLQRFVVRGSFSATQVVKGESSLPRSIPWQELEETVFREDLDVVRGDPYKHLQLGLLGNDFARSVAAVDVLRWQLTEGLLDEEMQDRVVDLLTGCLDDDASRLNLFLFRLLEKFTGVRCEPRVGSWKLWAGLRKGGRSRE